MRIGVLSDTHGLLRPEALDALRGVDHILHAGDLGDPTFLDALRKLAPVTAIRGNIDHSGPCAALPATEAVQLDGQLLYMVHALNDLDIKPEAAGVSVVIYGHSHKPSIETSNGVLYLNPGSAGPNINPSLHGPTSTRREGTSVRVHRVPRLGRDVTK